MKSIESGKAEFSVYKDSGQHRDGQVFGDFGLLYWNQAVGSDTWIKGNKDWSSGIKMMQLFLMVEIES